MYHLNLKNILVVVALVIAGATQAQIVHEDHRYQVGPDAPGWDHYGASVAVDNGIMAVGAWNAYQVPDHVPEQGFVYLYEAQSSAYLDTLMADNPEPFGQFGFAIDMDDGLIAVGAPDSLGALETGADSGIAYIFDAGTGEQLMTLRPDVLSPVGWFGRAIAIEDGVVAIWGVTNETDGTQYGTVFLFDAVTGEQLRSFVPGDHEDLNFWFGHSLDLEDGLLAVNAQDVRGGDQVGVVQVFRIGTGELYREVVPVDAADQHESFGTSISMDNGSIAVLSMIDDGLDRRGAVYTFDINGGTQYAKYTPWTVLYTMSEDIEFEDGVVGVGMFTNYFGGVVHMFDATGATPLHVLKPEFGDFGLHEIDIAMDEGWIGVGTDDEVSTIASGQAYFFGPVCSPDLNRDDRIDFYDISAFINAYVHRDYEADFDNNLIFDFFDVNAFLEAIADGC